MAQPSDSQELEYDRHYLDSFPASYVVRLLGFQLTDAQAAMRCDDIDAHKTSRVLLRLAAHFLMTFRSTL